MRIRRSGAWVLAMLFLLLSPSISAADLFTNLNFESYTGGTNFSDLLPGWTVNPSGLIAVHEELTLSTAGAGLVSSNSLRQQPVQGAYSAMLGAGVAWPASGWYPTVTIWQTAMVPEGATYIQFLTTRPLTNEWTMIWGYTNYVTYSYTLGPVDLLNGSSVEVSENLYRCTANIGALAGQTSTLTYSMRVNTDLGGGAYWHVLDDIEFISIPEPSVLASMFLGGLIMLLAWPVLHR